MSNELCRKLQDDVRILRADLDARKAEEAKRIELARTELPTEAECLHSGDVFSVYGADRILIKLPPIEVETVTGRWFKKINKKKVEQWFILDPTVNTYTKMGVVQSRIAVLKYMKENGYRRK